MPRTDCSRANVQRAVDVTASQLKSREQTKHPHPDTGRRCAVIPRQHHRDNCRTGIGFRFFLRKLPDRRSMLLFLTRMRTVPLGNIVNVILSPAFMHRRSRMFFGIVVSPLAVNLESLLIFLCPIEPPLAHSASVDGSNRIALSRETPGIGAV